MRLIEPPVALRPYSVPCGPRSTSTRSRSNSEVSCASARDTTAPSTCSATAVALPVVDVFAPTPRMKIFAWLKSLPKFTEGTTTCRSCRLLTCDSIRRSASMAATAELMSWMPVSRLVAVTTISSSSNPMSASSGEDCASAGMATAQEMASETLARTVLRDGFTMHSLTNVVEAAVFPEPRHYDILQGDRFQQGLVDRMDLVHQVPVAQSEVRFVQGRHDGVEQWRVCRGGTALLRPCKRIRIRAQHLRAFIATEEHLAVAGIGAGTGLGEQCPALLRIRGVLDDDDAVAQVGAG